jgi:hypothetical protein
MTITGPGPRFGGVLCLRKKMNSTIGKAGVLKHFFYVLFSPQEFLFQSRRS